MESRKAFLLRINADLWKELEAWAADELRSVNGQIEYLLREAVLRRRGTTEPRLPAAGTDGTRRRPPARP